jgi:hypothetical protein
MADEQEKVGPWKVLQYLLTSNSLLVFGTMFLLLGAGGGVRYKGWFPIDGALWRIVVVATGVVFIGLNFVLRQRPIAALNPNAVRSLGVKILYPESNATIIGKVDVRGTTAKPLPNGHELRILRGYPHGGFVPNSQSLHEDDNGWLVQQFDIGGSKGEPRTIEAWLVGPDGRLLLDTWLAAHEVHRGTISQVEKLAPREPVTWLKPIKQHTSDMYQCAWVRVTKG